ncbi:hypothetical protein PSHT_09150 [Puccinia striiformis]|uniref:Uncharacterized protein n=1 Tax=Puccinia striiformis TaxID=27350 RepID=A0A2S4VIV9_9BASI|nr:hypothetical protein PSHT_09150 [Puccinia striiformis]
MTVEIFWYEYDLALAGQGGWDPERAHATTPSAGEENRSLNMQAGSKPPTTLRGLHILPHFSLRFEFHLNCIGSSRFPGDNEDEKWACKKMHSDLWPFCSGQTSQQIC